MEAVSEVPKLLLYDAFQIEHQEPPGIVAAILRLIDKAQFGQWHLVRAQKLE
jgi:hypothetical protein